MTVALLGCPYAVSAAPGSLDRLAGRDREVAYRRDVARTLAEKQNRGDTEDIREGFIKIQNVIEAVERAIQHEKMLAGAARYRQSA